MQTRKTCGYFWICSRDPLRHSAGIGVVNVQKQDFCYFLRCAVDARGQCAKAQDSAIFLGAGGCQKSHSQKRTCVNACTLVQSDLRRVTCKEQVAERAYIDYLHRATGTGSACIVHLYKATGAEHLAQSTCAEHLRRAARKEHFHGATCTK